MSSESEPRPRAPAVKGNIIVVSAPSGAGKSSLVKHALCKLDWLHYSVSWTTRAPRGLEKDGVDYHFVTEDQFEAARAAGDFLEWARVHGNLYGTPLPAIEDSLARGYDVILDIDVEGARQVRERAPAAIMVFVLPPSREVLEERLRSRNQNAPDDLERRLRNATIEVARFEQFDYLIVNDDLARAAAVLEAIITAERSRPARQREVARAILRSFGGESVHA